MKKAHHSSGTHPSQLFYYYFCSGALRNIRESMLMCYRKYNWFISFKNSFNKLQDIISFACLCALMCKPRHTVTYTRKMSKRTYLPALDQLPLKSGYHQPISAHLPALLTREQTQLKPGLLRMESHIWQDQI